MVFLGKGTQYSMPVWEDRASALLQAWSHRPEAGYWHQETLECVYFSLGYLNPLLYVYAYVIRKKTLSRSSQLVSQRGLGSRCREDHRSGGKVMYRTRLWRSDTAETIGQTCYLRNCEPECQLLRRLLVWSSSWSELCFFMYNKNGSVQKLEWSCSLRD